MKRYVASLLKGDRNGWRTLGLVIGAILIVSALFWLLSQSLGLDENGMVAQWFSGLKDAPWALPAVIAIFTLFSFLGAPQFLLMALAVAAFGPWLGFAYSYIATMVSAFANFQAARLLGANWLRARGWTNVDRLADEIGANGFMAAMLVRIVPSGPFVVVNLALGLSASSLAAFMAGTAIGIIPKLAVVTLLGEVVARARVGDLDAILFLIGAIVLWLSLAFVARWLIARRQLRGNAS